MAGTFEDTGEVEGDILLEGIEPEEFADREGYDPNFLGVEVPLPTLVEQPRFGSLLRIANPARADDEHELRYHHYSVLMNADRRLAYLSASNTDYEPAATITRSEGAATWKLDPRVGGRDQLGSAYYSNNPYDKGHLTRREDVSWGRDKEQAKTANQDSFFYTNSAPQHLQFNQSGAGKGLRLWGELENHITEQGEGQRTRLSIFNGPVFGDDDKKLKDTRVPLAFYKIVIWRDGDEPPGAVGFLLDQSELVAPVNEAIDAGEFQVRQRRIADIEAMLDLDFGLVSDWDRMPATVLEGADEDGGLLLESVSDIRL